MPLPRPARFLAFTIFAVALLSLSSRDARAQATYTITDLGTLGGPSSSAEAINASGQVVGSSLLADGRTTHPFLYSNGSLKDLNTPDGGTGQANAINASGQVAGQFITRDTGQYHPFLFTPGAGFTDFAIATPGISNYVGSYATGINVDGQVVGFTSPPEGSFRNGSFLLPPGQPVKYLIPLGTFYGATAFAINDRGQIAGSSTIGFNPYTATYHAVIFEDQGRRGTDLGTLRGTGISVALGINNAGQAVGYCSVDDGSTIFHAFLSQPGASMTDLGTTEGLNSMAYGINSRGDVVGDLVDGTPGTGSPVGAFLYTAAGGMVDLNRLIGFRPGYNILHAAAINDAGQIVGYTLSPEREYHAYLLTPGTTTPPVVPSSVISVVGAPDRRGFVVSRPAEQARTAMTITYHNGGSAVVNRDYQAFRGDLTLTAGQAEAIIPIALLPGANRNHKVKVFLDPAGDGSYAIGKAQSKVFLSDLP